MGWEGFLSTEEAADIQIREENHFSPSGISIRPSTLPRTGMRWVGERRDTEEDADGGNVGGL